MKQSTEFAKRLTEIYTGEPWFGESILTKLNDVPEEKMFEQPKLGEHAIAQLLAHMEFWRKSILAKLEGDESMNFSMEHPDNWPSIEALRKRGWNSILKSFDETHTALINALHQNPNLKDDVTANLQGTIDHDIYHLAQIGYVKKLIS
jgi:hypothetical protein